MNRIRSDPTERFLENDTELAVRSMRVHGILFILIRLGENISVPVSGSNVRSDIAQTEIIAAEFRVA